MPTSLGDAREVGRLPGRDPACPHGSEQFHVSPVITRCTSALRRATVANVKGGFAANVSWRMKQCVCPAGRPGRVSARQPTYLFCFAKRRRREKATPEMAVRYADSPRPQHRKREASETRFAQTTDASLSVSGTGDAAPSTGIHCNGNGNGNGNFTSNGNGNGNRRCAGTQGELFLHNEEPPPKRRIHL